MLISQLSSVSFPLPQTRLFCLSINFESSQLAFPRFRAFLPPPPPPLFAPATGQINRCKLSFEFSPLPPLSRPLSVPLARFLFKISPKCVRACSQATLSPRSECLEQASVVWNLRAVQISSYRNFWLQEGLNRLRQSTSFDRQMKFIAFF